MNWKKLILFCLAIFITTDVALCSPLSCNWHVPEGTWHGRLTNVIMKKDWNMTYLFTGDDGKYGCVQFSAYTNEPFIHAIRDAFLLKSHVDMIVGKEHEIEELSYDADL